MASGLVVTSYPRPALAIRSAVRTIWETSPGPVLVVTSYPKPAIAIPSAVTVQYDIVVTSYPLPALAIPLAIQSYSVPLQVPAARPVRTFQRDIQKFATTLERERHVEALWQYGELVVFALLWTTLDQAAGLAQRCPRCNVDAGTISAEQSIAAAYGQGSQYRCPVCYGSQFTAAATVAEYPGLRALLVRPAILTDLDKAQQFTARGVMNTGQLNAESTPDFRVRNGDYMFRQDGSRFRLRVPRRVTLRTGFAEPYQQSAAITYTQASAALEDPTSVAYIIPPDEVTLASWLGAYTRLPVSYQDLEVRNGPLIPEEQPPPGATGSLQPNTDFPLPVT